MIKEINIWGNHQSNIIRFIESEVELAMELTNLQNIAAYPELGEHFLNLKNHPRCQEHQRDHLRLVFYKILPLQPDP